MDNLLDVELELDGNYFEDDFVINVRDGLKEVDGEYFVFMDLRDGEWDGEE